MTLHSLPPVHPEGTWEGTERPRGPVPHRSTTPALELVVNEDDWRERAACADSDPGLWFADETGPTTYLQAKLVCRRCPSRDECLDYALTNGEQHGLWGGLSPKERHVLARLRSGA